MNIRQELSKIQKFLKEEERKEDDYQISAILYNPQKKELRCFCWGEENGLIVSNEKGFLENDTIKFEVIEEKNYNFALDLISDLQNGYDILKIDTVWNYNILSGINDWDLESQLHNVISEYSDGFNKYLEYLAIDDTINQMNDPLVFPNDYTDLVEKCETELDNCNKNIDYEL